MTATDQASSGKLAGLLSSASVEVSSRGHQLQELRDHFARGTDVTITFLPGDNYRHNIETAAALRRAGFNPVPHIAAREMASREMLDDFLARLRGEAEVSRLLLVAGDVALAKGPFKSSLDLGRNSTDSCQRHSRRPRRMNAASAPAAPAHSSSPAPSSRPRTSPPAHPTERHRPGRSPRCSDCSAPSCPS